MPRIGAVRGTRWVASPESMVLSAAQCGPSSGLVAEVVVIRFNGNRPEEIGGGHSVRVAVGSHQRPHVEFGFGFHRGGWRSLETRPAHDCVALRQHLCRTAGERQRLRTMADLQSMAEIGMHALRDAPPERCAVGCVEMRDLLSCMEKRSPRRSVTTQKRCWRCP